MIKILHIASFQGNVGDNISHIGFYKILEKLLPLHQIEQIEIRRIYKNYHNEDKLVLDKKFIDFVNSFDYCFVGGGGFLDYWVEGSQTGTTFDIDPKLMKYIKIPFFFTSIGCNPHKEIPKGNLEKIRFFLDKCNENKNIHLAIRNDGSIESIKKDIGESYLHNIVEVLDHGFFFKQKNLFPPIVESQYIAINITDDQLMMKSSLRQDLYNDDYLNELIKIVLYSVEKLKLHVVFVPHIYSDIKAIYKVLEKLDQWLIRRSVSIAPLVQGDYGANQINSIYCNADYIFATRLHANICSIAMKKNVVGLAALDRIEYLYRNLNENDRVVIIKKGFGDEVIKTFNHAMEVNFNIEDKKEKTLSYYINAFKKHKII